MKKIRFGVMVFVAALVGIVAVAFICAGCADGGVESGGGDAAVFLNRFRTAGTSSYYTIPFIDARDGKTYKKVKMPDGKTWMAENLNFEANGSSCLEEVDFTCDKYYEEYGRLYNWDAAKISCPSGWRLPSNDDWSNLINSVGSDAATKLKSRYGWPTFDTYDANGTDDFKFSALPGGGIISKDYNPDPIIMTGGFLGAWWTDTEDNVNGESVLLYKEINYAKKYVMSGDTKKESSALSVRCILAD